MERIHFVGVSGIGMSALARICLEIGYTVSGSSDVRNDQTEALGKQGMSFFLGHEAGSVDRADAVVRSAAVPLSNPELREAVRRGIPVYLYSEFLGTLMGKKRGIAVAGTHGKTTTTALTGWILANAGLDPTVVCGGVMRNFSANGVYGEGDYIVAEACEYQKSFLNLQKSYSIVTNVEEDHLDFYRDIRDIKNAFTEFLIRSQNGGCAVINGDDPNLRDIADALGEIDVLTVGYGPGNSYRLKELGHEQGSYSFLLSDAAGRSMRLALSVPGRFNCINAALASALALRLGVRRSTIKESVRSFRGTERRLEYLGMRGMQHIYTDYAHHPTEIACTIKTLREAHVGSRICVVFQPHQHSRTMQLFDGFVDSLLGADCVILTTIYRQRDSDEQARAVSSGDLLEGMKKRSPGIRLELARDDEQLFSLLTAYEREANVVAFLGAGDVDATARRYAALQSRRIGAS